jgi:hypothetical protein
MYNASCKERLLSAINKNRIYELHNSFRFAAAFQKVTMLRQCDWRLK